MSPKNEDETPFSTKFRIGKTLVKSFAKTRLIHGFILKNVSNHSTGHHCCQVQQQKALQKHEATRRDFLLHGAP